MSFYPEKLSDINNNLEVQDYDQKFWQDNIKSESKSELTVLKVSLEVQDYISKLQDEIKELIELLERVKDQPKTNETTDEQTRIIKRLAKLLELMAQSQKNNKIIKEEIKEENIDQEPISEQISRAQEIMGKGNVFNHEAIKIAFGAENIRINLEQIPNIPFSEAELERASELGQFLILRVNQTADGQPLTMENMNKLLADEFQKTSKGKILPNDPRHKKEDFFLKETPQLAWALVTKEVIPDSLGKNYLKQTIEVVNYLKNEVFVGQEMPKEYKQAIIDFENVKDEIAELISQDNWSKAVELLEELAITKLTRQTPVEVLYDSLVYFQNIGNRLLEETWTWTGRCNSDGKFVSVGSAVDVCVLVNAHGPDFWHVSLGVSFSRCSLGSLEF